MAGRLNSAPIEANDQAPLLFSWHRVLARLMLSGDAKLYYLWGFVFYQLAQQVAA